MTRSIAFVLWLQVEFTRSYQRNDTLRRLFFDSILVFSFQGWVVNPLSSRSFSGCTDGTSLSDEEWKDPDESEASRVAPVRSVRLLQYHVAAEASASSSSVASVVRSVPRSVLVSSSKESWTTSERRHESKRFRWTGNRIDPFFPVRTERDRDGWFS